jgi:hypothetical protein
MVPSLTTSLVSMDLQSIIFGDSVSIVRVTPNSSARCIAYFIALLVVALLVTSMLGYGQKYPVLVGHCELCKQSSVQFCSVKRPWSSFITMRLIEELLTPANTGLDHRVSQSCRRSCRTSTALYVNPLGMFQYCELSEPLEGGLLHR